MSSISLIIKIIKQQIDVRSPALTHLVNQWLTLAASGGLHVQDIVFGIGVVCDVNEVLHLRGVNLLERDMRSKSATRQDRSNLGIRKSW